MWELSYTISGVTNIYNDYFFHLHKIMKNNQKYLKQWFQFSETQWLTPVWTGNFNLKLCFLNILKSYLLPYLYLHLYQLQVIYPGGSGLTSKKPWIIIVDIFFCLNLLKLYLKKLTSNSLRRLSNVTWSLFGSMCSRPKG